MKNRLFLTGLLLLIFLKYTLAIHADVQTFGYYSEGKNYLEICLYIPTEDLKRHYAADSSFNHQVQATLVLKSKEAIQMADKVNLQNKFSNHSAPMLFNLRWEINPGDYELEVILTDLLDIHQEISLIKFVHVEAPPSNPFISDIQLLSTIKSSEDSLHSMVKYGFYYEPLPYSISVPTQYILPYFIETYQTNLLPEKHYYLENELFLLDTFGKSQLIDKWIKRRETKSIDYIVQNKDISHLPSGKYILKASIKDKAQNTYFSTGVEFYRMNPFWDRIHKVQYENSLDERFFQQLSDDSIHIAIKALYTLISTPHQAVADDLINQKKLDGKRMFVYRYWKDSHGANAIEKFQQHMELVNEANRMFYSGFGYGFESDRGRIYLKYGKPIEIFREEIDAGAYPYEIWKYDKIQKTGQNNVKFLFYNLDMGGQNYRLLHSTAYGELSNPKWELELYRKVKDEYEGENPLDAKGVQRAFSRRARDFFNE
ncbi:MAG: GWxTD domain-containing protein [Saprospiraceae bacterium]|nr:GWxTD domain-containing protein [Saprospiraceae bacterium]